MQRQAENTTRNIGLLNMSKEDSEILFHLLAQHSTVNYFRKGIEYPISINDKPVKLILSH